MSLKSLKLSDENVDITKQIKDIDDAEADLPKEDVQKPEENDKRATSDSSSSSSSTSDSGSDSDSDSSDSESIKSPVAPSISLELGDVIDIAAPSNEMLDGRRFIIDYIDENKIVLIDLLAFNRIQLNIDQNGVLDNNSITEIDLINRNEEKGYARQNNLLPGTWLNIFFGGDRPAIITGQITNIEEDMIEITTFPERRVIYIPFNYRGIPDNLPIEKFEIRRKPEPTGDSEEEAEELQQPANKEDELDKGSDKGSDKGNDEAVDMGYEADELETINVPSKKRQEEIEEIIDADQIVLGDIHERIAQYVDVDVKFKRYNIDAQTNDLLDSMLSTIPTKGRSKTVLKNIHTAIERFKQLRTEYSSFNKNGVIDGFITRSHLYKPLKFKLSKNNANLYWLLQVAKNEKKIYTSTSETDLVSVPDVSQIFFGENMLELTTIIEESRTKPVANDQEKYVELYNAIKPFFTPFNDINVRIGANQNIIAQQYVTHDSNVIIDNYSDLKSTAIHGETLQRKRFLMQRYVTGLTHLENVIMSSTNMDSTVGALTPNDRLSITSLLTLPPPAIKFSKINLPGTSILESANLNTNFLNYWQLLKESTAINKVDVSISLSDDQSATAFESIAAKKREKEQSYKTYFDKINHFIPKPDENALTTMKTNASDLAIYNKYLDNVIPTTKDIFNIMSKYINGRVSLVNVVDALEPFLIYASDLTFKQYQMINEFIDCKISKYNKSFIERRRILTDIKNVSVIKRKGTEQTDMLLKSVIFNVLNLDYEIKTFTMNEYNAKLDDAKTSNSELLKNILMKDFGNVFNSAMSLVNTFLINDENLDPILNRTKEEFKQNMIADAQNNKCKNYVIAKKYRVKTDMDADNDVEIYYDAEFDKTPYGILDDYTNEKNKMHRDEFKLFLTDKLQKTHKFSEPTAAEHAESFINGMKKVREGDYAIFFNSVKNTFEYYIRENNAWKLAENVDKSLFINNDSVLCNMQDDCLYSLKKIGEEGVCENLDLNKDTIRSNAINSVVDQFDKKYMLSKEEQTQKFEKWFAYYSETIRKLDEIAKFKYFKNNNKQYEIGLQLGAEPETILSPYSKYLDVIMGQEDINQRYANIIRFTELCTRPPMLDKELPNFLYCTKTDVPLLPKFLSTLAIVFTTKHDDYTNELKRIIRTNGVVTEDGDRIVDKFSGKLIALTNFSTDEGYDESGFQIRSRDLQEEDWGLMESSASAAAGRPLPVAISPETALIHKIVNAISSATGIAIPNQMDFIVRNVKNTLIAILPTEEEHSEKNEALEKKGKQTISYETFKNTFFLYLTLGMFIVAVQTNVPSIKTKKTFPGCSGSLDGYPLEGASNKEFITYLACIAFKMKTSTIPWNVLLKKKEDYIASTIFGYIESYLITIPEVSQKLVAKHEYLNGRTNKPPEPSSNKKGKIRKSSADSDESDSLPSTNAVATDFHDSLLNNLKTGSFKQTDQIHVLQSKIIHFSYAIKKEIHEVVTDVVTKNVQKQNHLNLLINHAGSLAIENTCCNEETNNNTLQYFKNKNDRIEHYNRLVRTYSGILSDIKYYTTACMFSSRVNTKNIFLPSSTVFSKNTIYRAFILYCKFNSLKPMPKDLIRLCKDKPVGLIRGESIETQIDKLEKDGREYNNENMLQLLQIVSRKNVLNVVNQPIVVTKLQKARALFENLYIDTRQVAINEDFADDNDKVDDKEDKPVEQTSNRRTSASISTRVNSKNPLHNIIPQAFQDRMLRVMDTYDVSQSEESEDLLDLHNYLLASNKNMKKTIVTFLKANGNVSRSEADRVSRFLDTIMVWGSSTNATTTNATAGRRLNNELSDSDMYNSINFIKTYLANLIKIFPNVILKQNTYNSMYLTHWGLTQNDKTKMQKLVLDYYVTLNNFYGNADLEPILVEIQDNLTPLLDIANETPIMSNINLGTSAEEEDAVIFGIFGKKTGYYLFENYFLTVLNNYITVSVRKHGPKKPIARPSKKRAQPSENFEDDEYADYSEEISENQQKEIKHHVALLLVSYLNIMENHKVTVNLTYDFIMNSVFKIQQAEKNTFTSKLERFTEEAREVDTVLKMHKLGDWNKGMQKSLTTYNKNNDDDETRVQNEKYQTIENALFKNNNVTDRNVEQYMDDYLAEAAANEANDMEELALGGIDEDYYDGNPYGDEP